MENNRKASSREFELFPWKQSDMLEINLAAPDDFLKVKETLTRMGVASWQNKKLYQSCHILHKQGRYFIVHFKEMYFLDGHKSTLERSDIQRRNTIATLLSDWGLIDIVDPSKAADQNVEEVKVKVVKYREKSEWELCAKYSIGNEQYNGK